MPPLSFVLDDIGNPTAADLARAFNVSERTVRRWITADQAPRPVMLALWWLTRWGASQANADAHNAATLHAARARALDDENQALKRELSRVLALNKTGASNAPLLHRMPLLWAVPVTASS